MKRLEKIWTEDSVLLNSYYHKDMDVLLVTTKSATTGNKTLHTLEHPLVPINVVRPDIPMPVYKYTMKLEDMIEVWVPEKYRVFALADYLGVKNYAEKVKNKQIKFNHIHLHKRLFGSDKHISDMVIANYVKHYTQTNEKGIPRFTPPIVPEFHIGALDIESDILNTDIEAEQPINVITYIDKKHAIIKTVALRNSNYIGQKEIEKNIKGFEEELMRLVKRRIDNIDLDEEDDPNAKKKKEADIKSRIYPFIKKLKLDLTFTNSEANMIRDISKFIFNKCNPDFLYIYNAKYDISHIKMRSEKLNVNFDNLFRYKDCDTFTDFKYDDGFDPTDVISSYDCYNPTKILDQWTQYYTLRSANNYSSTKLDATVKREVGINKLDYSHITNHIMYLPYKDYRTFLMYNIVDVLVMLYLDMVTNDTVNQVYSRLDMLTEFERLNLASVATTNANDHYTKLLGYINGNEINKIFLDLSNEQLEDLKYKNPDLYKAIITLKESTRSEDDPLYDPNNKVKGGLVSKPTLLSDSIKNNEIFPGLAVKTVKFKSAGDNDAVGMYPSNNAANNATKDTLYGVINGINDVIDNKLGPKVAMSIINRNVSSMGNYFYNLPTAEELINKYYNAKPFNIEDNTEDSYEINCKDFTVNSTDKRLDNYTKLWKKCYRTKYDKKDLAAGNPTNSLILFSDKVTNTFSYYGTKVKVTTDVTTNELINMSGTGINLGLFNKSKGEFINKWEDYDSIRAKHDPPVSGIVAQGILDIPELKKISNIKLNTRPLKLGKYTINLLSRVLFTDFNVPINWYIYSLSGVDNCYMLKLYSHYEFKNSISISIEQNIIFYNLERKEDD